MRPGPATRAALLSRKFWLPSFAWAKDHRATALRKVPRGDACLKLSLQGYGWAFPSFSKEGFLRRPLSPGSGALDMRRISPDDSLSKSPATPNPHRNRSRTSRAFDCLHCAAAGRLTQRQSEAPLCKNCGGGKVPVDGEGKARVYSRVDYEKSLNHRGHRGTQGSAGCDQGRDGSRDPSLRSG
jgi:hypothetical protein